MTLRWPNAIPERLVTPPDLRTAHIRLHGGPLDGQLVHWPDGMYLRLPDWPDHFYNLKVIAIRDTHTYEGYWEATA